MKIINYCPCCNGKDFLSKKSIIAPFISDYVLNETKILSCKLLKCNNCGFIFFDKRFTDREVNKLYSQYRKQTYFKARNKHEFFYTAGVNKSFDLDDVIEYKKKLIYDFIRNCKLDCYSFKNILDYGGDRGQFFPSCFDNSNKWLYEISDKKPLKNVIKFSKFTKDKKNFFDLILLCHLLEHISYPNDFLSYIRNLIKINGYVYIEVPNEQFKFKLTDGKIFDSYISFVIKHHPVFNIIDALSLFLRLRFRFLPFWGIMKLHEHINFFSINSLIRLLENNGFKVIKIEEKNISKEQIGKCGRKSIIQCLAIKKSHHRLSQHRSF